MSNKVQIDRKRDKKGNITLRLRWWFEGNRPQLSLGVRDDALGRAYAEMIQKEIAFDLSTGQYDSSKKKYQNPTKRKAKPGQSPDTITAVKLFQVYTKYYVEDREICKGAAVRLSATASKLQQFLVDKPASQVDESVAKSVVSQWGKSAANNTLQSYLYYLKGCWDWAKGKYSVVDLNPWEDSLARSKARKNRTPKKQPKPFTIEELQAIIGAFASHPQYYKYTDFVVFRANTGTRIGEAIGLKWLHLGSDFTTAWIGESIVGGERKGTKNGKTRTIQLSPMVQTMLTDRHEQIKPKPDDLVFKSPKGLSIDPHNFCNRIWKIILSQCDIEYRSP